MTVKELKEELDKLPDNMSLKCYSSYNPYTGTHSVKDLDIYFVREKICDRSGYYTYEVAIMSGDY